MYDTHNGFSDPVIVTTLQGGQNGLVFPIAPVYEAQQLKLVRASIFVQAVSVATGVMDVSIGYQVSDDGVSWPVSTTTPVAFTSNVSRQGEGVTIGNFEDITNNLTKRFVRFVFWTKNTTGNTGLATCLASLRLERRAC